MEIVKIAYKIIKSKKIEEKNKSDEKLDNLVILNISLLWAINIPHIYIFIEKTYGTIFAGFILTIISTLYLIILFMLGKEKSSEPEKLRKEQAEDIIYLYNHMTEIEHGEELLKAFSLFVQERNSNLEECPVYQTALTRITQHQNIDKIKQMKFWLDEQLELNSLNLFNEDEIKKHIDDFINTINQKEKIDMEKEKQRFIDTFKYQIINSKLVK